MSLHAWLLFAAATTLLSLTPGPNGLLALTHGGLFGARRTVATALGGVTGFAALMGVSLSGLGALLAASEAAFGFLRWAGALYLVWLGVRTWRAPPATFGAADGTAGGAAGAWRGPRSLFGEGLLVALSNPKAILFFVAFLPPFVDPARSLAGQFALMVATLATIEFAVEIALAAGSERIRPWLARDGNLRGFQRLTGALFVGAGAALLALGR